MDFGLTEKKQAELEARMAALGLREADLSYRPTPESMSIAELAGHVLDLVSWVAASAGVPACANSTGCPMPVSAWQSTRSVAPSAT